MFLKTRQNEQSPIAWFNTAAGAVAAVDADPIAPGVDDGWLFACCRPPDNVQSGGFAIRVAAAGTPQVGSTLRATVKVANIDPDNPDNNVDLTDEVVLFDFGSNPIINPVTTTIIRLETDPLKATSPAGNLVGLLMVQTGTPAVGDVRPQYHVLGWPLVSVDAEGF